MKPSEPPKKTQNKPEMFAGSVRMKLGQGKYLPQETSNYKNGRFILKWKQLV